jgi:ABC-2 type transport system ATP-binding protein
MNIVETAALAHNYGSHRALSDVTLTVPEGSVYALIGANGAGKSTLLRDVAGLQRPTSGRISVFGKDPSRLTVEDRMQLGYVAEGLQLPKWMTVGQLEAFVAPLYDAWDYALASDLRVRFRLDATRKVGTLSRGEHMKAALLCAIAPRPRVLIMDEPFTGVDVVVKDELVRGLLDSVATEGTTVLICSHDLAELEPLADWIGFMDASRLRLSQTAEAVRSGYQKVEITGHDLLPRSVHPSDRWMSLEQSASRLAFVVEAPPEELHVALSSRFPSASRIDVRPASLREVFVALATSSVTAAPAGV